MMQQTEGFKIYSKTIGGQQHFKRKLQARGNEIKTMFTSWAFFNSSILDVTPLLCFVGDDTKFGFKYLPVWKIVLEETMKKIDVRERQS